MVEEEVGIALAGLGNHERGTADAALRAGRVLLQLRGQDAESSLYCELASTYLHCIDSK